jgi:hypothetical protein
MRARTTNVQIRGIFVSRIVIGRCAAAINVYEQLQYRKQILWP